MGILVTGGAGFIGSHICERLLESGNRIICIDNFNDFYDPAIKESNIRGFACSSSFLLYRQDILNRSMLDEIFSENNISLVIHLAARAGVRPSIENASLYEEVNVRGTLNLLECCAKFGVKKFIFASSSSVYGGNKKIPFSETDNVDNPVSPYAATKKAGELLGYTYSNLYGISVFCYRFFTVYGPRQRPEMAIHKFTRAILTGSPLEIYGDGNSARDYTYIDDIVTAVTSNLENIKGYEIFNLGNSKPVKLLELVKII
ncbi:MAG: NAD-dependent epimerase/dehydratase family protein, partial [Actinobacteria bacterium]|nr:NAD-dependent epimerase/dehydratase family protein [Actinomycetota bacterium]